MLAQVVLTVSESKRLIAKGVAASPQVQKALSEGMVAVTTGSTNGYLVEELLGDSIEKNKYMTGATLPAGVERSGLLSRDVPDLVLQKGEPVEGMSTTDAVREMGPGDVFVKGANAVHYESGRAGLLIGHPTGGTIGAAIGTIIARRIHLVVPVGLEKNVVQPIEDLYYAITSDPDYNGPTMWPFDGEIVTEIESVETLTDARAMQLAGGGLAGAEGAVRLLISGDARAVESAVSLVESIQGEPPFVTRS